MCVVGFCRLQGAMIVTDYLLLEVIQRRVGAKTIRSKSNINWQHKKFIKVKNVKSSSFFESTESMPLLFYRLEQNQLKYNELQILWLQRFDIGHHRKFCDKYWRKYFLWLQRLDINHHPEFCDKYWTKCFRKLQRLDINHHRKFCEKNWYKCFRKM